MVKTSESAPRQRISFAGFVYGHRSEPGRAGSPAKSLSLSESVQQALQHPGARAESPRQGWQFVRYAAAGRRSFGLVRH